MTSPTKVAWVRCNLLAGHSITQRESVDEVSLYALAQAIAKLRKKGLPKVTDLIPLPTAEGRRSYYARYAISPEDLEEARNRFG